MNERTFDPAKAHRLDDPQRLVWTPPEELIERLGLKARMSVADIGAGTGFFAIPFAQALHPGGSVWAVDLQPEMLHFLRQKLPGEGGTGDVHLVQGDAARTGLPDSCCDVAFLANLWHELDDHAAVLAEMRRVLRPGGRIGILDWRPGVSQPPGPPLNHRIPLTHAEATLQSDGWRVDFSSKLGPYSYLLIGSSETEAR